MTASKHRLTASPLVDAIVREGLSPVTTLCFEPAEAQSLQWLPLAVRYKLDQCRIRISLAQWQALTIAQRTALLAAPLATEGGQESFARCLAACIEHEQASAAAGGTPYQVGQHFTHYVRAKRSKEAHPPGQESR